MPGRASARLGRRTAAALLLASALGLPAAPAPAQQGPDPAARGDAVLEATPELKRLLAPDRGPPRDGGAKPAEGGLAPYEARALVEPRAEAVLSSDIGGRIVELPVDEGDRFQTGDLLVAFDCSFHRAELAAAQAELTKARHTLTNKRQLAELKSVGQLEVAVAQAEVAKAEAQLRTRRLFVERCRLTAPYAGRVVERPVNRYETVAEEQELMRVIAAGGLRLRLIVPSRWLSWLEPGARFWLTIDETGRTHAAEVKAVGARVDPVSQTVPLYGRLLGDGDDAAGALRPGMSGTARFDPPKG